ncbi:MAG: lipoyl(octanoyl) transferase LipB [Candidatus Sulfotelmatobacter sp.]
MILISALSLSSRRNQGWKSGLGPGLDEAAFVYTATGGFRSCEIAQSPDSMISVLQLRTIDYAAGIRLQQKLVQLRKDGLVGDVLLLLEHAPVITLGRNAKASNVLASRERLAECGVEIFECDRGGDVTFHGPGQIVGYPIFDLRGYTRGTADAPSTLRKTLGAVDFIRRLEEVLMRSCADFAIPTKRQQGLTGVWTDAVTTQSDVGIAASAVPQSEASKSGSATEAKLAAIGVHISRFVTSHGFALNVNTDLSYFDMIVPCGITSKPVTSMQRELGREVDLNAVGESISRNFGVVFQSQMLWMDTLDSLLGRTVGVPVQAPEELRQLRNDDTYRA